MAQGTVKSFNAEKGYGWITPEGSGSDLFAHYSEIQSSGFRSLDEGDKVEFEIGQGTKGPQAQHIVKL
ncbi:cold-shock protein [Streptomyces sp. NPDC048650]|uniref:cold-shock protein n=1 Tax=unclassified Streptomyces TaxID=2593676 RepID=UPI003711E92F